MRYAAAPYKNQFGSVIEISVIQSLPLCQGRSWLWPDINNNGQQHVGCEQDQSQLNPCGFLFHSTSPNARKQASAMATANPLSVGSSHLSRASDITSCMDKPRVREHFRNDLYCSASTVRPSLMNASAVCAPGLYRSSMATSVA